MEITLIAKAVISLSIILIGLYFILKIVQKYTSFGYKFSGDSGNSVGLKLENVVYIDENTKLVTVKSHHEKKTTKYILAVGKNDTLLVDKLNCHDENSD